MTSPASVLRPVDLRAFPPDDPRFGAAVDAAFARLAGATGEPAPAALQAALRETYPAAIVVPRDALADPGLGPRAWYVYRYGSITTPGRRWWREPGHASAIVDDERRFLEVSDELATVIEAPPAAIVGRPVEAFAGPGDPTVAEDAAALWARLLQTGHLHATLRFRFLDGTPRELEYHVARDEDGPGRHRLIVREAPPDL